MGYQETQTISAGMVADHRPNKPAIQNAIESPENLARITYNGSFKNGQTLPIVTYNEDGSHIIHGQNLEEILMKDGIKDLPFVVVFFVRKFRKTKSGINRNLDSIHVEEGSEWKNSSKYGTRSLFMWSEPIRFKLRTMEEVAVIFMGTSSPHPLVMAISRVMNSRELYQALENMGSDEPGHCFTLLEFSTDSATFTITWTDTINMIDRCNELPYSGLTLVPANFLILKSRKSVVSDANKLPNKEFREQQKTARNIIKSVTEHWKSNNDGQQPEANTMDDDVGNQTKTAKVMVNCTLEHKEPYSREEDKEKMKLKLMNEKRKEMKREEECEQDEQNTEELQKDEQKENYHETIDLESSRCGEKDVESKDADEEKIMRQLEELSKKLLTQSLGFVITKTQKFGGPTQKKLMKLMNLEGPLKLLDEILEEIPN